MKTKKRKSSDQQFGTYPGIDPGDRKHYVCATDKDGNILEEFTLTNTREPLQQLAADHPKAKVAIELGTHSPWIGRLPKNEGMEVTVANARKLRAIHQNDRKCDELDARMLAKLLRADAGLPSPVRHGSEQARKDLPAVKVRDSLVRQRVHIIATIRGLLKSVGLRLPATSTVCFHKKAREALTECPEYLPAIEPALDSLENLTKQIKHYDKHIAQTAQDNHPDAVHLQQIPSIGPITSPAFVLNIEYPHRFKDPRDAGAYLGPVPRRDQSGGTDRQLPISKSSWQPKKKEGKLHKQIGQLHMEVDFLKEACEEPGIGVPANDFGQKGRRIEHKHTMPVAGRSEIGLLSQAQWQSPAWRRTPDAGH